LRTGLLILAPLVALKLLILPFVHALGAARDQLNTERGLLRRELALLEDTKRYPVVLEAAEGRAKTEIPRLFRGADELSATAALSYYASEQARRTRVLVEQIDARPAVPAGGGLRRLEVSLRMQSDLSGVLSWLDALERGPRLVRVEQIAIERGASSATWESLDVSCTLVGYAAIAGPTGDSTDTTRYARRGAGE
jgi:hypothetical protein